MRPCFHECAHTQVDSGATHVFGRRKFLDVALGITIDRITAPHGGEHRLGRRLFTGDSVRAIRSRNRQSTTQTDKQRNDFL